MTLPLHCSSLARASTETSPTALPTLFIPGVEPLGRFASERASSNDTRPNQAALVTGAKGDLSSWSSMDSLEPELKLMWKMHCPCDVMCMQRDTSPECIVQYSSNGHVSLCLRAGGGFIWQSKSRALRKTSKVSNHREILETK